MFADAGTTFTATISRLDPGQTVRITVPFRQNGEQPDALRVDNTATVSNTNLPNSPTLSDTGSYFLIPAEPTPTIAKTVSSGPGGSSPGGETVVTGVQGEVRYSLDVTLPRDQNVAPADVGIRDVMVRDVLPDGMALTNVPAEGEALGATGPWSITCVSGPCASAEYQGNYVGARTIASRPGATEAFFYFGDYNDTADAVFRITFTAKSNTAFLDGTPVSDGVRDPRSTTPTSSGTGTRTEAPVRTAT